MNALNSMDCSSLLYDFSFHLSPWHKRVMLKRIRTELIFSNFYVSVSSGILSQRMFVMLPCGGVGVRENTDTALLFSKALNERDIKQSLRLMKDNMVSKRSDRSHERKFQERQDIKKEKRVWLAQRLPDSPCWTMTSQTNENNMFMTGDKRNASDFIVRARWTVMPVCEQMDPATWIWSRNWRVKLTFLLLSHS